MTASPPLASPRPRHAESTRAAILEAAVCQFAQLGYDNATLRDIAAQAGSDVALVARYFGGKEGLFVEALKASIGSDKLRAWSHETFAQDVSVMMADGPRDESHIRGFQFLLRAATSPTTAPLLNLAVQERFLEPISDWLGGADSRARARVLAASFIGLLVERLIRGEALAGREREVFMERVTTMIGALVADGRDA